MNSTNGQSEKTVSNCYEPSKTKACLGFIEARHADIFRRQVRSYVLIAGMQSGLIVVMSEWDWYLFWNLIICLEADRRLAAAKVDGHWNSWTELTIKVNHIPTSQEVYDSKSPVLMVPLKIAKASGMRFRYVCECGKEHQVDALVAWHTPNGSGEHECECGRRLHYRLKGE